MPSSYFYLFCCSYKQKSLSCTIFCEAFYLAYKSVFQKRRTEERHAAYQGKHAGRNGTRRKSGVCKRVVGRGIQQTDGGKRQSAARHEKRAGDQYDDLVPFADDRSASAKQGEEVSEDDPRGSFVDHVIVDGATKRDLQAGKAFFEEIRRLDRDDKDHTKRDQTASGGEDRRSPG